MLDNEERNKKIRAEMGANQMTKTQLAREMGYSLVSVIYKLNGDREWTVKDLKKLAEIFRKEQNYFF